MTISAKIFRMLTESDFTPWSGEIHRPQARSRTWATQVCEPWQRKIAKRTASGLSMNDIISLWHTYITVISGIVYPLGRITCFNIIQVERNHSRICTSLRITQSSCNVNPSSWTLSYFGSISHTDMYTRCLCYHSCQPSIIHKFRLRYLGLGAVPEIEGSTITHYKVISGAWGYFLEQP